MSDLRAADWSRRLRAIAEARKQMSGGAGVLAEQSLNRPGGQGVDAERDHAKPVASRPGARMEYAEMASGKAWSREELMVAMNLYCRIPFGQLHQRNPLIVTAARQLGRSPGSLAMKLCNLASLDPVQQARGIRGLSNASLADREVWEQFHSDWEGMAVQSEGLVSAILGESSTETTLPKRRRLRAYGVPSLPTVLQAPTGPTEAQRVATARIGQQFFRRCVLASYRFECAVTGNPVPEMLVASHILPWSEFPQERMNPHNGICLAAHFDRAFDQGLLTFDQELHLVLSPVMREYLPNDALQREFFEREGREIRQPDRFLPSSDFLRRHRERVFQGR
jgi:hypothetical protein